MLLNVHVLVRNVFFSELTRTIVQGWLAVHNVVDVGGVIPVHVYAGSNIPADPYYHSFRIRIYIQKSLYPYPVSGSGF
jgi:hypothetical protein